MENAATVDATGGRDRGEVRPAVSDNFKFFL